MAVLLRGVLACTLEFLEYIIPAAVLLLCLHHFFRIPSHVFRKLLHLAAFTCLVEMMWAAEVWYQASLTVLLFAAAVYPILCALENRPWFGGLFVQKEPGEVKKSLLLLFVMDAVLVAVCWGIFDLPWVAAAAILMWDSGDGAAARNESFSHASMDYCMWLDADDLLLDEDRKAFQSLKETLDPTISVVMAPSHRF